MSIAIVTDSTSYIEQEYIEAHNVTILPLSTTFSDGTYVEGIDLNADQFYQKMAQLDEIPTTSQPSSGVIKKHLKQLAQNYDEILVITLSGGISGTVQTIHMLGQEIRDANVHVYDSGISCQPEAFLVKKAVALAEQGKTLTTIISALDEMNAASSSYFVVDDLNHLAKGGRLSQAGALMGGLLKIKPLLYFVNGKIEVFEKVRTSKKAALRIIELFEQTYQETNQPLQIGIIGPEDNEMVTYLSHYFKENYSDIPVTFHYFGPVIGTHLGANAYGVTWTIQ